MPLDRPFPLVAVPSRVRHAILNEFNGRCPSIREVVEKSDRDWLTIPGVGPAILEMIRSVTDAEPQQAASPARPHLTDVELLDRLECLQDELRWLQDQMEARLLKTAKRRPNRRTASQDADHNA
jgi:hypothetical protein